MVDFPASHVSLQEGMVTSWLTSPPQKMYRRNAYSFYLDKHDSEMAKRHKRHLKPFTNTILGKL